MPRQVVVTGGTGALGRAVVRRFLELGDRVLVPWIVASEREHLEQQEATAFGEGALVAVEADVSEERGADAVCEAAGAIDVLVNGVGGFGGGQPVHQADLELWDHLYRINLRTAVAMSRAATPRLISRGGSILLVASQAATTRPAGLAAYAASKAGVVVLTEALQKELAGQGVRVNAVAPGTIDTPANRDAMPDADFSTWTPPARIARVLSWLASEDAGAVRGAVVPV